MLIALVFFPFDLKEKIEWNIIRNQITHRMNQNLLKEIQKEKKYTTLKIMERIFRRFSSQLSNKRSSNN